MAHKHIILSCIIVSIVFIFFYFNLSKVKSDREITDSTYYLDLSEEYYYLNNQYKDIFLTVFVGDSITKRFNINEFSSHNDILNRGIFSDTTQGLLQRYNNNISNLRINKLFILIGHNDLIRRVDELIINNILAIAAKSKAKETYVQSILPVSQDKKKMNKRIIYINNRLKAQSTSSGYIYIDLHSQFIKGDLGINPKFTRDGIHPNYSGYQLWFSIIEPFLAEQPKTNISL